MNVKILTILIFILLLAGSFGSVGINVEKDSEDCECGNQENFNYNDLCGLKVPDKWWETADFDSGTISLQSANSLPDFYDLRLADPYDRDSSELDVFPDVRDQEYCGSCWAFATVGALEINIARKENREVNLSEQWLISCNKDDWDCGGGWWAHSYHEWKRGKCGGKGAVLESDFEYEGSDNIDWRDYTRDDGKFNHAYLIDEWHYVGIAGQYITPSTDEIKNAMINHGPIAAAVNVNDSFHDYDGGLFEEDETPSGWIENLLNPINHAVLLVGWDDNYQGTGTGVWILRNSWGTDWGDNGYMYIKYDISNVGYSANYIKYTGLGNGDKTVEFEINKLTNDPDEGNYETIEGLGHSPEPDWFYDIWLEDSNGDDYTRHNRNSEYFVGIENFIDEYTWNVTQTHRFQVNDNEVDIYLKLMDDDEYIPNVDDDDLADISAAAGGGKNNDCPDKPGAVYHAVYNLATDTLTGDETLTDGDWFTTEGAYSDDDETNNAKVWFDIRDDFEADPDLSCSGSLSWSNVDPSEVKTGSFSVSNIGDEGSVLYWEIDSKPSWVTIDKSSGSLTPADGEIDISVDVTAPNKQASERSGTIRVVDKYNSNDYEEISVYISTLNDPVLNCTGGILFTNAVDPGSTVYGSFTVRNVGESGSKLDWEISNYPSWGGWSFDPSDGTDLTPEDDPVTVTVTINVPDEKFKELPGLINVTNSENEDDWEIIPVYMYTAKSKVVEKSFIFRFFEITGLFDTPFIKQIFLKLFDILTINNCV